MTSEDSLHTPLGNQCQIKQHIGDLPGTGCWSGKDNLGAELELSEHTAPSMRRQFVEVLRRRTFPPLPAMPRARLSAEAPRCTDFRGTSEQFDRPASNGATSQPSYYRLQGVEEPGSSRSQNQVCPGQNQVVDAQKESSEGKAIVEVADIGPCLGPRSQPRSQFGEVMQHEAEARDPGHEFIPGTVETGIGACPAGSSLVPQPTAGAQRHIPHVVGPHIPSPWNGVRITLEEDPSPSQDWHELDGSPPQPSPLPARILHHLRQELTPSCLPNAARVFPKVCAQSAAPPSPEPGYGLRANAVPSSSVRDSALRDPQPSADEQNGFRLPFSRETQVPTRDALQSAGALPHVLPRPQIPIGMQEKRGRGAFEGTSPARSPPGRCPSNLPCPPVSGPPRNGAADLPRQDLITAGDPVTHVVGSSQTHLQIPSAAACGDDGTADRVPCPCGKQVADRLARGTGGTERCGNSSNDARREMDAAACGPSGTLESQRVSDYEEEEEEEEEKDALPSEWAMAALWSTRHLIQKVGSLGLLQRFRRKVLIYGVRTPEVH
jgi:hypothetical protein